MLNSLYYRENEKPRMDFDEIKMQIALGTIPPEYIKTHVCNPEILDKLANILDDNVRFAVAVHPHVKLETLMRLLEESADNIPSLVLIAAHPKIPIEVLYKLAKHKNPQVSEEAKGVLFIRSKGRIDIQDN